MNRYKKELTEELIRMNSVLRDMKVSIELILVGGSAFILKNLISRATIDYDYINDVNEMIIQKLNSMNFNVNNRVNVHDAQFGPDWKEDLVTIQKYSNLSIKSISDERLMISRLFIRKRHEDFEAAIAKSNIQKEKFEDILQEVYMYASPVYSNEFKENKYMLENLYKEKRWDYENSNIKDLFK